MREYLAKVLAEYQEARETKPFKGHPLGELLRKEIPDYLRTVVPDSDRYKVIGTQGKGRWADVPWVAILDKALTTSTEQGYYPVYLFRGDLTGVYLSLNQGTEKLWIEHGRKGATYLLQTNASEMRKEIVGRSSTFPEKEIQLHGSAEGGRVSRYEVGNVVATFYDADNLPPESRLQADLLEMLEVYDHVLNETEVGRRVGGATTFRLEEDESELTEEDATKLREHKAYDRQSGLSAKVKNAHGYVCKACGFDFERRYGEVGRRYIEAHHLVPFAELKGKKRRVDPAKDFTVLCANCHRMIHKSGHSEDLLGFKKVIRQV